MDAVRSEGGDVLKFIGDGVLSVFSAGEDGRQPACLRAARAIGRAFGNPAAASMRFVAALHVGPVVYGNIGSPDRLDFTVVGPTVNYVSRLEGVAQIAGPARRLFGGCRRRAAGRAWSPASAGIALKGFADPQEVFELTAARARAQS